MHDVAISFTRPLSRAWKRTGDLLWRPFDARIWFVLGFSSFLAGIAPGGPGSGLGGGGDSAPGGSRLEHLDSTWERIAASGLLLGLVVVGATVVLLLLMALLWLSSRGKFIFLDNVLHSRAAIVEPWHRFRTLGNSLFLFRAAFALATLLLVGIVFGIVALTVGVGALLEGRIQPTLGIAFLAAVLVGLIVLGLLYAAFFLEAFVVPLMHRYDLRVLAAWRRFLAILRDRPLPLLALGLAALLAFCAAAFAIVAFGLLTCCLGFLLLMLPYVSDVILLPLTTTARAYTLEFLAQFDADLLPAAVDADPAA